MTETQITYVPPSGSGPTWEPDNSAEVLAFIGPDRSICDKCHGTGEYEGEHYTLDCQLCNSRLISFNTPDGPRHADWGDTIVRRADGSLALERPPEEPHP